MTVAVETHSLYQFSIFLHSPVDPCRDFYVFGWVQLLHSNSPKHGKLANLFKRVGSSLQNVKESYQRDVGEDSPHCGEQKSGCVWKIEDAW